MSKIDRLRELYAKTNGLDEDYPKDLLDKLSIYGQILSIIGDLHADSTKDWKLAEAQRRDSIANFYSKFEGTVKDKEMEAEAKSKNERQKEAEYEGESLKWKNRYNSTVEQIQIMKKKYDHLREVSKGGI
jgi:hypothetical protein